MGFPKELPKHIVHFAKRLFSTLEAQLITGGILRPDRGCNADTGLLGSLLIFDSVRFGIVEPTAARKAGQRVSRCRQHEKRRVADADAAAVQPRKLGALLPDRARTDSF